MGFEDCLLTPAAHTWVWERECLPSIPVINNIMTNQLSSIVDCNETD